MTLASIAKRGNPQVLWPDGCKTVEDLPWDLSMAISHAFSILAWHENRPKEKIPPRWMWPHADEVDKFFQRVDDEKNDDLEDDGEGVLRNEYADRFK